MNKVRIEFKEVAGYPQIGTIHVWVNGQKVTAPLKDKYIKMLENR